MKKIVANFKMNMTRVEIKNYFIKLLSKLNSKHEVIICPPFTALPIANYFTENSQVVLGAQNICEDEDANCTGEISGKLVKDCGASYVIIGHAERRTKYKENNKTINTKIKTSLKNRLKVILCVGETLAEKNIGKTKEIVKAQVQEAL